MIKSVLHIEYGLFFVLTLLIYLQLDYSFWYFLLFLLVPDISMIGYLLNTTFGAFLYNLAHSFILPICLLILAILLDLNNFIFVSLIWLAHIYMDRFFGFGLKYSDSFNKTHMQND